MDGSRPFAVTFGKNKRAFLNHFHRTFRHSIEKCLSVALAQYTIVQHHHDALVALRADQSPHALTEFQNRLG